MIDRLRDAGIKPVIDIRNCWKDGEETHQYRDTDLVYNYKGDVWYVDEKGKKCGCITEDMTKVRTA